MRFGREVQLFVGVVGVVLERKAVRTGEEVSLGDGSVGNVISAVVVTLIYRKHANLPGPLPSENGYRPSMLWPTTIPKFQEVIMGINHLKLSRAKGSTFDKGKAVTARFSPPLRWMKDNTTPNTHHYHPSFAGNLESSLSL